MTDKDKTLSSPSPAVDVSFIKECLEQIFDCEQTDGKPTSVVGRLAQKALASLPAMREAWQDFSADGLSDKQGIMVARKGVFYFDSPVEHGCDERTLPPETLTAFYFIDPATGERGFVDDQGFHYNNEGISSQAGADDENPLRLYAMQPLPEPPKGEKS